MHSESPTNSQAEKVRCVKSSISEPVSEHEKNQEKSVKKHKKHKKRHESEDEGERTDTTADMTEQNQVASDQESQERKKKHKKKKHKSESRHKSEKKSKKHKKHKRKHESVEISRVHQVSERKSSNCSSVIIIDTCSRTYAIGAQLPSIQSKDKEKKKKKKKERDSSPPRFTITRVQTEASKRIKALVKNEEMQRKIEIKKREKELRAFELQEKKLAQRTPEELEREAQRQMIKQMTPEQLAEYKKNLAQQQRERKKQNQKKLYYKKRKEFLDNLTDEQRVVHEQRTKRLKMLRELSPESRRAELIRCKNLTFQKYKAKRKLEFDQMTPEQKEQRKNKMNELRRQRHHNQVHMSFLNNMTEKKMPVFQLFYRTSEQNNQLSSVIQNVKLAEQVKKQRNSFNCILDIHKSFSKTRFKKRVTKAKFKQEQIEKRDQYKKQLRDSQTEPSCRNSGEDSASMSQQNESLKSSSSMKLSDETQSVKQSSRESDGLQLESENKQESSEVVSNHKKTNASQSTSSA